MWRGLTSPVEQLGSFVRAQQERTQADLSGFVHAQQKGAQAIVGNVVAQLQTIYNCKPPRASSSTASSQEESSGSEDSFHIQTVRQKRKGQARSTSTRDAGSEQVLRFGVPPPPPPPRPPSPSLSPGSKLQLQRLQEAVAAAEARARPCAQIEHHASFEQANLARPLSCLR